MLTLDLHTVQVQGFFDIPVDNLFTMPLFAHYYRQLGLTGMILLLFHQKIVVSNVLEAFLNIWIVHWQS